MKSCSPGVLGCPHSSPDVSRTLPFPPSAKGMVASVGPFLSFPLLSTCFTLYLEEMLTRVEAVTEIEIVVGSPKTGVDLQL